MAPVFVNETKDIETGNYQGNNYFCQIVVTLFGRETLPDTLFTVDPRFRRKQCTF
jgi:hypothetical protein